MTDEAQARWRHSRERMRLAEDRWNRLAGLPQGDISADELYAAATEVNDARLELDLAEIAASAPSPRR